MVQGLTFMTYSLIHDLLVKIKLIYIYILKCELTFRKFVFTKNLFATHLVSVGPLHFECKISISTIPWFKMLYTIVITSNQNGSSVMDYRLFVLVMYESSRKCKTLHCPLFQGNFHNKNKNCMNIGLLSNNNSSYYVKV